MNQKLKHLEKHIGYTFQNQDLLQQAMTHSSYANERQLPKYQCNETTGIFGRCSAGAGIQRVPL